MAEQPPKYYAGIGSRKTPLYMLGHLEYLGLEMADRGYILRSGGAQGSDQAFERGCDRVNEDLKEIFFPKDAKHPDAAWAFEEVKKHIPEGYPKLEDMKPFVQLILARNMMQILGRHGDSPSEFVICWTMARIRNGGGTGYAMRCAQANGIEVYNLQDGKGLAILHELFKEEK